MKINIIVFTKYQLIIIPITVNLKWCKYCSTFSLIQHLIYNISFQNNYRKSFIYHVRRKISIRVFKTVSSVLYFQFFKNSIFKCIIIVNTQPNKNFLGIIGSNRIFLRFQNWNKNFLFWGRKLLVKMLKTQFLY